MAASCLPAEPVNTGDDALQILDGTPVAEGEFLDGVIRDELIAPIFEHFLPHGPDLIQEHGNQLIVVDQLPFAYEAGSLFVFERTTEGGLEQVAEVKLDFVVDQMIVHGDQVLLFGNDLHWPVILAANVEEYIHLYRESPKPFFVIMSDRPLGIGDMENWFWREVARMRTRLVESGVPFFPGVDTAARAVKEIIGYYHRRDEV